MLCHLVPACGACGGMLKPDVVFFGENVPKARVAESYAALHDADGVLVVVAVLSATAAGAPIAAAAPKIATKPLAAATLVAVFVIPLRDW